MDSKELADHIARLDTEASEQEALAQSLQPYSDPGGSTTVGEIVAKLRSIDPARAQSLLKWVESFVERGSSIAARSHYVVWFKHNEVNRRPLPLKNAMFLPVAKMMAGTQAFLIGSHSADEAPSIADQRAEAVAAYLRACLPPTRAVTVRPHACSEACQRVGDDIHFTRRVDVKIFVCAEMLAVGPIRHRAESTRNAHREYSELALRGPEPTNSSPSKWPIEHRAHYEAQSAALNAKYEPTRSLWRDVAPYYEVFKYESMGALVDSIERVDPGKAHQILETVCALVADPTTPHDLAGLSGGSLKFLQDSIDLEVGQETELADLLSEMNTHDGGTTVELRGWHEKDEGVRLADRRAHQLLGYFKARANPNVGFRVRTHVCGDHCDNPRIPLMRRIAWVDIFWQPRNVLIEDLRIVAQMVFA